jgi:opacity protein-like surface antigen
MALEVSVKRLRSRVWLAALWLVLGSGARAQEPSGPPPAPGPREPGSGPGLELLPEIGRIGAQVGLLAGTAWNPYDAGRGLQGAGYIRLPLAAGAGGRLSYEVRISLGESEGRPFFVTDSVAFVANLAAGASPAAALAGPPAAPFPVRREVRTRLKVLQVSPFALTHTFTGLDRAHLRPYLTAGLDAVVIISKQGPLRDESLVFTGQAPFDAELIAGLIGQAPELTAQGLPTGQGNIEFGFHAGAGLELRVSRGISINGDYRYSQWGDAARQSALAAGVGFHW